MTQFKMNASSEMFQTKTSQIILRMFTYDFLPFYRLALSFKEPLSAGMMSKWCPMPLMEMNGLGLITGRAMKSR